jgi:pimeloyl-ACP methyl ester carboxylesterase
VTSLPAEDSFADLGSGRICYRQDGRSDAPAVVLVAGLGMQLIEWPEALVTALAREFRVIRLDNRDSGRSGRFGGSFTRVPAGFSWSESAPGLAAYDLRDMARDVLDLADHLGIDRFACVGFSMGGMIAQILAVMAPRRVRGVVSLSSTGGDASITATPESLRLMERFFLPFASETEAACAIRRSNAHFSLGLMPEDSPENHQLAAALVWRAADGGGYLRQALAITTTRPWRPELLGSQTPMLFLHGDRDPCIDAVSARQLAAALPRAGFRSHAGLGHWMDERTGRDCVDWLTALRSG